MKKIVLGALVGAIIFFVYESVVWMGGFHNDFSKYSPNQTAIMQTLNANLTENGAYMMPSADLNAPDAEAQSEKLMNEGMGKPWAMVFYHKQMNGMDPSYMLKGFLNTFLACLIAAFIIFQGRFNSFGKRFLVGMGFSVFALLQCTLAEMNWWDFPWHYVKSTVFDLTVGWALVSLWFAWYVKETGQP